MYSTFPFQVTLLSGLAVFSKYSDGFAQNIKLWSQKTPLLSKHVPTNAQPTTEGHPLLGNAPTSTCRGKEYAIIEEVHC
jgi:hypothetical protein